MRLLFACIFFIVAWSSAVNAEAIDNGADSDSGSTAKRFFEDFKSQFRAQILLDLPAYWFYLGGPAIQGEAYLPDLGPRLGARVFFKDLGIQATFALPEPESEQYRRGSSTQTEVILNPYWRQTAMDFYYQHFRGFYATSPGRELSVHRPARYPQFPDATVTNAGINFYYVYSPETFSLKAAFSQQEFQLESGGSWILSPFYNHLEMFLGSAFVPGDGDDSVTGVPNLASARIDTAGATYGYGYSYIKGRFFASALGGAGPGVQVQQLYHSDGKQTQPGLALKFNVNAAMGWSTSEYVGGLQLLFDSLTSNVGGELVASNLLSAKMFFGARF